jgi:hypothetical protein
MGQSWSRSAAACVLLSLSKLTGCVSAPPETIELADIVQEQISSIETSHRNLVRAYFELKEQQLNALFTNEILPQFLASAVQNDDVQAEMDKIRAGINIDPEAIAAKLSAEPNSLSEQQVDIITESLNQALLAYRGRLGQLAVDFGESVTVQINAFRDDEIAKLRAHERTMMSALDGSYQTLRTGSLALRAYLDSVAQVVEQQDRVASALGLKEARDSALDAALESSDKLYRADSELNRLLCGLQPDQCALEDEVDDAEDGNDDAPPLSNAELEGLTQELEE